MRLGGVALGLERNHDAGMLAESTYPASRKRRIAGRYGHLENSVAADLLSQIDCSKLQHLVAAHLSERNNLPSLAVAALARVLDCDEAWIGVATPESGFDWRGLQ